MWNIARTSEQIQSDMYNAHAGSEDGLLVYWKANAGAGTVLYDHTGNANHARLMVRLGLQKLLSSINRKTK